MQKHVNANIVTYAETQDPETVLDKTGLTAAFAVHANLAAPELVAAALERQEGVLSEDGAFAVQTGVHTGRSAKDKFIVDEPQARAEVWWSDISQKMSVEHFQRLTDTVRGYLSGQELFTQDLYAGADPAHRIKVRVVTTNAWHALFARNMFIRPAPEDLPLIHI